MQYEPIGYILEYEISALIFLIVIITRYFAAKRFPNQKNRLFAIILWLAAIDIFFDIVSSLVIDNVFDVPVILVFFVNSTFYLLQLALPFLMILYTLTMSEHLTRKKMLKLSPLFLPSFGIAVMLLINPLTHSFFYVDAQMGYVHGPVFIYTYLVCLFYILATLFLTNKNKNKLRKEERSTVYVFLGVIVVSMIIQYMYPALLITGVAIALAVTLMYFTIQNPDSMLDNSTQAFTYEAMIAYLNDRRLDKKRVQLLAIKIHNMFRINETLGINNGNTLLKDISSFLLSSTKDSWVFRMRSNCFVLIMDENEDDGQFEDMINRRIAEEWTVGNTDVLLQATVCHFHGGELVLGDVSSEETMNYIERAFLQNEKFNNPVEIIHAGAETMENMKRSRKVEEALRESIKTGAGFELYLQPLWSVKEEKTVSAEVLLRYNHPSLGSISPNEFVPIAESSGLITAMDEMVVHKACELIRDNDHYCNMGIKYLEINLSALEFMMGKLPQILKSIMSHYDVAPEFLCFEITETAATQSFELLRKSMEELKLMGCKFALDDFGTGYANVSNVIQLPFSIVKLDKSLLYGTEIVLEDMVRMFTRMKKTTVIEGVETREQAQRMKDMGVDYIQGYYYGKPMSADDFSKFIQQ